MTQEEFNSTEFTANQRATYKGKEYDIISVNFEEMLIGLDVMQDEESIEWVRCENCTLITNKK